MAEDTLSILQRLTAESQFELEDAPIAACPASETPGSGAIPPKARYSSQTIPEVFRAKRSGGGETPLLKTVLTTACERNCNYCAFRAGRDVRRGTLIPDQMAELFSRLHTGGIAEGMFLSSGVIGGGVRTQDKIIATAEILRLKYGFKGYLHLKIMPGAEKDQVLRTMQLADRVSVNLEAPNIPRLRKLAPLKLFSEELLQPLKWVEEIRKTMQPLSAVNMRWPSLATQFVVGGVGETDMELLQTSQYLHTRLNLSRIYFSRFTPISDTPFENQQPEHPLRQLRLYQAAFLLRDYGYGMEDFHYTETGHLPLDVDPKLAWARVHLSNQPVEINRADSMELLRIPGIGPLAVKRILKLRKRHLIKELDTLRGLGIHVERAIPFILINGKQPDQQLPLF